MDKTTAHPGQHLIFRPYITLKDGTKLWARNFGLKAWPIWVDDDPEE